MSFHLFVSSLISFISVLWFSEYRSFVSLGTFTPRYFILLDVMENRIASLISPSDLSLLVCRNAVDFCVLILYSGVPFMANWLINPTRVHDDAGSIRGLAWWVRDPLLPWLRCGSQTWLALLWLWHRLAAVALIPHLAWELPYAIGGSPKKKKQNPSTFV